MDVSVGGRRSGKMVIELFSHIVPKTCKNFRMLCSGEAGIGRSGKKLHFQGVFMSVL